MNTTDQPTLAVTQADRDAAAHYVESVDDANTGDAIRAGRLDCGGTVQAFARHRTHSEPRPVAGLREAICSASPDHADIMETIDNAADDWQKQGYTSALAEVRDMANVGRALMEALPKGYSYMNCPSEIVSDLQNERDEALATHSPAPMAGAFRPFAEWHEDHGDVLWWKLPVQEPPYLGSPIDLGFSVGAQLYNQFGDVIGRTEGNVGGWPFSEDDQGSLVWSPLPAPPAAAHPSTQEGGK